jgi:polysaccharide export outer membrane protein
MRLNTTAKVGFVALTVLGSTWAADPPSTAAPDYRIGPGDVISVQVYKEPEASVGGALVRSDGKVTLPLIDDVYVQGMTTAEVKKDLTGKFTPLIPGADVTVRMVETHSKKVFLDGKVRRVGPLDLHGPMTILQAINTAGGFNDYAKVNKIYILRNVNGKQTRIDFDYNAVVRKGRPDKDIPLEPDDYIYVP